jgi:hypothetical protein
MIGQCRIDQINDKEVLVSKSGGHWGISDWAEYKYIDFGEGSFSTFKVFAKGKGSITLKIDGSEEISHVQINNNDFEWAASKCKNIHGIHPLWLFFDGDITVEEFFFE